MTALPFPPSVEETLVIPTPMSAAVTDFPPASGAVGVKAKLADAVTRYPNMAVAFEMGSRKGTNTAAGVPSRPGMTGPNDAVWETVGGWLAG
jgi:hypothetical protein